jgi:hypothetical protein
MSTIPRREKGDDDNYVSAIGNLPPATDREPVVEDVIEDLRDDVNDLCDLANTLDGLTFTYTAAAGRSAATLVITHRDGTSFTIT